MELIPKEHETGKTYINKLAVGERQLAAAIRMYFLELDPLAIHTVCSAAHNVLADLLYDRGKDPSVQGFIYGLLRAARDMKEGNVTEEEIIAWGDGALELVQDHLRFLESNPSFDIEQIQSSAPESFRKSYWSSKRRAYNFLKHADRDAKKHLDEAEINNADIILEAISFSLHLNSKYSTEKHFFYCAMLGLGKLKGDDKKPWDLELILSQLSGEKIMALGRRNLCRASFPDDDTLLEGAIPTATEILKQAAGKDIQFFKPD